MFDCLTLTVEIIRYIMYLISPTGIVVCLLGFWRSKKGGYILITIYFLLGLVLPPLHTYIKNHDPAYIELKKNIDEANEIAWSIIEQRTNQKKDSKTNASVLNFQLGELILLIGVTLLVSKEKTKTSEQALPG